MAESKPYDSILFRDGTSRTQRLSTVLLDEDFVLADERSLKELWQFAASYATSLNYFGTANSSVADGTWEGFFDLPAEEAAATNEELAALIGARNDREPHLALYLTFIKLFTYAQQHLNKITQRHLDFYYEEVLGLELQPGKPDRVYAIFELAKNATELLVQKGTLLDAGKNVANAPLQYMVTEDVVINKTVITDLKTVSLRPTEPDVVCFATVANSGDGIGGKLDPVRPYWDPFGLRHIKDDQLKKNKIGFALASPMLFLKEGERILTVTLKLSGVTANIATANISRSVELFFTAEKSWIGPFGTTVSAGTYNATQQTQDLIITHTIDTDQPAITAYNSKVHLGSYVTENPLLQVLVDTTQPGNLLQVVGNARITNISMTVAVTGVTSLDIENDFGVLNAKKPFLPFGPLPKKGSSFNVGYSEVMLKDLSSFSFDVDWQAAPSSFNTHYKGYVTVPSNNTYFGATYFLKNEKTGKSTNLFNTSDASQPTTWPDTSVPLSGLWFPFYTYGYTLGGYSSYHSLFSNPNFGISLLPAYTIQAVSSVSKSASSYIPPKGFVRFELKNDFLHAQYPGVYAVAVKTATNANSLPNEPYTPTIKSLSFNYNASMTDVNPSSTSFNQFNQKKIQLFHIGVFGQAEQHGYLKASSAGQFAGLDITYDQNIYLLPQYRSAGNFLIGMTGVVPGQSVSFLFQLAEGSANPSKLPQEIRWYALCNNEWRQITSREIVKDETNHLLRSGIVRLVLPDTMGSDNTWMEHGKCWLMATVQQDTDALCTFIDVLPQAAGASFVVTDAAQPANTLDPEKITKLATKVAAVKKISQPYSSFDGRAVESQENFYTRVSERLRHKQRAVMQWDYEALVLQAFPELYKVKCLNHTGPDDTCCNEVSPGHVTLLLVPDTKNKNAFDPLEPKLGLDTLSRVAAYMQQLVGFFVQVHVQNPAYEKVLLQFKVRFTVAGDFGLYAERLNEAIMQYLTPWAYDATKDIQFGGRIHKSLLLNFIEEVSYVDFVTELQLIHVDEDGNAIGVPEEIVVKNPRAILVSAGRHLIFESKLTDVCV
ncbi:MAG: baseplate J/gp47 family protein [Chitinophagaceae bacterium]